MLITTHKAKMRQRKKPLESLAKRPSSRRDNWQEVGRREKFRGKDDWTRHLYFLCLHEKLVVNSSVRFTLKFAVNDVPDPVPRERCLQHWEQDHSQQQLRNSGMSYLWSFVKQHHLTVLNLDLKPIFLRSIFIVCNLVYFILTVIYFHYYYHFKAQFVVVVSFIVKAYGPY